MLRAIILIALVGHAAADIKCYDTTTSAVDAACAADSCWTLVPTDKAIDPIRGCGLVAVCNTANTGGDAGTCNVCTDDKTGGCNAVENDPKCWVGTVTAGVVDGAAEVCRADVTKCFTKTMTDLPTTEERGCGVCEAGSKYTCSTNAAEKECEAVAADNNGCNIPIQTCFKGTIAGDSAVSGQCDPGMLTCFTRTKTLDKSVDFGCGDCVTGSDYTCGAEANCGTIMATGCNEPPRFQCLVKDDWKVDDNTTVATDCDKLFTETSCTKVVKDDGTINKACGACPSKAEEGQTCYQCDETGCNSASGLFSVLALSMAVIYQLA